MPDFKKLIKPQFKLKSDADAQALQSALDVLFPITERDDQAAKTIKHGGNQWTFVRGKFFEKSRGFIVDTSSDGSVTGVKYSLEIK